METTMKVTKKISMLAMGIALYVVLSMTVKIPLIGHIQTDLGYIAYGVFLSFFGFPAILVGVLGCIIESLAFTGWFPVGWIFGQIFIGVMLSLCLPKILSMKNKVVEFFLVCLVSLVAVFIGVGLIKTIIESNIWGIPFPIKFMKNVVATLADTPPLIIGVLLSSRLKGVMSHDV